MSESYTVHKNKVINGVDPTHTAFPGENIYYSMFRNLALNATDWYISIITKFGFVIIRLKQVLIIDLKMKIIDETNTLPSICKNKQA